MFPHSLLWNDCLGHIQKQFSLWFSGFILLWDTAWRSVTLQPFDVVKTRMQAASFAGNRQKYKPPPSDLYSLWLQHDMMCSQFVCNLVSKNILSLLGHYRLIPWLVRLYLVNNKFPCRLRSGWMLQFWMHAWPSEALNTNHKLLPHIS